MLTLNKRETEREREGGEREGLDLEINRMRSKER